MLAKLLGSLLIGASVAAAPGPVFFILIKRTLTKGFWQGVLIALGEFTGNLLVLSVIFFWASQLFTSNTVKVIFYILGGLVLLWFSRSAFRLNADEVKHSYEEEGTAGKRTSFLTGLTLAVMNVDVAILWVSLSGSYLKNTTSHALAFIYILFIALGFLVFFIPLAYMVNKIRHKISVNNVVLLSKISGAFLVFFAMLLFYQALILK